MPKVLLPPWAPEVGLGVPATPSGLSSPPYGVELPHEVELPTPSPGSSRP